jgi:hypothetical protein
MGRGPGCGEIRRDTAEALQLSGTQGLTVPPLPAPAAVPLSFSSVWHVSGPGIARSMRDG